jgi:putative nucleotidyltransferase with HDIG domain
LPFKSRVAEYFKVDRELIIVFLLVSITGILFFFVSNQRAFLNFFYLPVLVGAYFFGRRYATQSALFSVLLIMIIAFAYPATFSFSSDTEFYKWLDIITWAGFLVITGYCMGFLYEKKEKANREIRQTYRGIIEMLSLIIDSADRQTQSHSYRVSVISEMIAREMMNNEEEVERIRVAALLHDLGKLGVSNEVLGKIGKLSAEEKEHIKAHAKFGADLLEPVGGRMLQILPLIMYHHERHDGSGYQKMKGEAIPLGARIIAVADVYDSLISDRSYRQGLPPFQAREEIINNSGGHFDPEVVKAFLTILPKLDTESPFIPQGFRA